MVTHTSNCRNYCFYGKQSSFLPNTEAFEVSELLWQLGNPEINGPHHKGNMI